MARMHDEAENPRRVVLAELDEETRSAVLRGLAQARRGEFVSDEDMRAFFERHGVKP
jgi:predicted transcriptional regulator